MRSGSPRMLISAMLAVLAKPLISAEREAVGRATLDEMFRPRFDITGGQRSHGKSGKHRNGGQSSPRPNSTTDWRNGTQAQESARRVRKGRAGDERNWLQRKAWLERNQHVIAKREADQERARLSPGKNATIWGRP